MKLFVYSRKSARKSDGAIDRLQGQIESCMQGKIKETFNSVESLSRKLCQPNTTIDSGKLFVGRLLYERSV